MSEGMGTIPCSARISKISTDSFESSSTSSGEDYQNLVTPGLCPTPPPPTTHITFFSLNNLLVASKMRMIYHLDMRLPSGVTESGPSQSSVVSDRLSANSRDQLGNSGKFHFTLAEEAVLMENNNPTVKL